jgi:7-carboxy-7-deazaguanine synthase
VRLSEVYTSTQGEGPGVGELTQFIRFAGCNLKCPAWPCDTPFAIYPAQYRNEWKILTPHQVMETLDSYPKRVTLTGGEPFLQRREEMDELHDELRRAGYHIDVFTNGTMVFPDWVSRAYVDVIMDWKLPGSGELIPPHMQSVRKRNLGWLVNKDSVKFVCAHEQDFLDAVHVIEHELPELFQYVGHLYVGAVWGKVKEADVVEWIKKSGLPFKLNVQVHNYVWPPHERRR